MIDCEMPQSDLKSDDSPQWDRLSTAVLRGEPLSESQGLDVLASPDEELLNLLAAVYRVRRRYFGRTVQLYFLVNAKSGLCPEDCGYCSQSKVWRRPSTATTCSRRAAARRGSHRPERQSRTYCIVISGRGPTERNSTP